LVESPTSFLFVSGRSVVSSNALLALFRVVSWTIGRSDVGKALMREMSELVEVTESDVSTEGDFGADFSVESNDTFSRMRESGAEEVVDVI
jgi:hypothetical protein